MIRKSQAELLLKNDTFTTVFDIIRQEQVDKFLHSGKDDIAVREDAHTMMRVLKEFERILKRAVTNGNMQDKRENKGQHRGSD